MKKKCTGPITIFYRLNALGFLNDSRPGKGMLEWYSQVAGKVWDAAGLTPTPRISLSRSLRPLEVRDSTGILTKMNGHNASERWLYFHAVLRCTSSSTERSKPKPCHSSPWPTRSHNATHSMLRAVFCFNFFMWLIIFCLCTNNRPKTPRTLWKDLLRVQVKLPAFPARSRNTALKGYIL